MASVLIVDEDKAFLSQLSKELKERVISVHHLDPGEITANDILSTSPDLVLYNINQAQTPGPKIISNLQTMGGNSPAILFVYLSEQDATIKTADLLDSGADDAVSKSMDMEQIGAKVHALLQYKNRLELLAEDKQVRLYKALAVEPQAEVSPLTSPITNDILTPVNLGVFQRKLRECLKLGQSHTISKLQFVSLVEFRATFGDSWRYLSSRVLQIAESTILYNLGPDDVFTRQGDDGFLLLMAETEDKDPHQRAELIADEIRIKLLGEDAAQIRQIPVKVATITEEEIEHAIEEDDDSELSMKALNTILSEKIIETPAPAGDPLARFFEQINIRYNAVWNSQKSMVSHYQCFPTRSTFYGQFVGADVLHGGLHDPLLSELDLFTLSHAARAINTASQRGEPSGIIVPLHYSTFLERGESAFREVLHVTSKKLLESYLVLDLIGLTEVPNQQRIVEFVDFLSNYSRYVGTRCGLREKHLANLGAVGINFLSIHISELAKQADEEGKDTLSNLYAYSKQAKSIGAVAYVRGIDRMLDLTISMDAHVPLLSGLAISQPSDKPGQIRKWSPSN